MYKSTAIITVIAFLILGSYLFISNPDKIVIGESGKVEGVLNKARAMLQGDRFWYRQLKMATEEYNKTMAPRLPSSSEMQDLYNKMREYQEALDEKMKPLYTPEEQEANRLRIKADSLERASRWRVIDDAAESARVHENESLKSIIPFIEAKLHIVNR